MRSILIAAALLVCAAIAEAQQPKKVSRIGYLSGSPASAVAEYNEAFRQGLRELGYIEGSDNTNRFRTTESC